ncbi:unnamed protein product [Alopecurus aequalis]
MEASVADGTVRIVSRLTVRPSHGAMPMPSEDIQLTPWDLYGIRLPYNQKGILLPKPPAGGETLVDTLASSLARALGRYYHFAGRLAVQGQGHDTVTISLRCTGEGAELVHAAAPGVAVADIVGSVYTPSSLVSAFFPSGLTGTLGADAAMDSSIPVLSAQVTELLDGVFIGISMNHTAGDGNSLWELFNAWSAINRADTREPPSPPVLHQRWFLDTSPVPIPLPSSALQHVVPRFEPPPAREGFFTFSAASVKKLKVRANEEMACSGISSLQALLAHLWRAVARAGCLPPAQEMRYVMIIGARGRIRGIPSTGYVGNAITAGVTGCTVGEILDKGLGWTAWKLNRAVASFDESAMREWLDRWAREPTFLSPGSSRGGQGMTTSSSPRFDVFGNDFGWGKPVAVRSGRGDKMDGKVTVFEGPERGGSISLAVCLAPQVLERLVADQEFIMDATP